MTSKQIKDWLLTCPDQDGWKVVKVNKTIWTVNFFVEEGDELVDSRDPH